MGFFSKLEKLSERYIEGFFKTKFADHIQPAEIAKMLLREMRDNKNVSVSRIYVPNEYTVLVSKEDWATIESVRLSLARELQEYLAHKAQGKGYEMVGAVKVSFESDEELPLGTVSVSSSYSEDPKAPTPGEKGGAHHTIIADREQFYAGVEATDKHHTLTRMTAVQEGPEASLVQKTGGKDGKAYPLGSGAAVIGRRKNNDIFLEDSNVSRVHASVDCVGGDYMVTDLGSTNGTFVNGHRVSRKKLAAGDLIRVGSTILEFRVV